MFVEWLNRIHKLGSYMLIGQKIVIIFIEPIRKIVKI